MHVVVAARRIGRRGWRNHLAPVHLVMHSCRKAHTHHAHRGVRALDQRTPGRFLAARGLPQRADVVRQRRNFVRHHLDTVERHPGCVLVVRRREIVEALLQRSRLGSAHASRQRVDIDVRAGRALCGGGVEVWLAACGLEAEVERHVVLGVRVVRDGALLVAVAEALLGAVLARRVARRGVDLGVAEGHHRQVHDGLKAVGGPGLGKLAVHELLTAGSQGLCADHHVDGLLRTRGGGEGDECDESAHWSVAADANEARTSE